MKVVLPEGKMHGWGVAGENLTRELSLLPHVEGVALHASTSSFRVGDPAERSRRNIVYCFFELDIEASRHMRSAAKEWDLIVAGSRWCEYHLRIGGVNNTCTIHQGVDKSLFAPMPALADNGRFIVFSGGKFELRKSQDLVIAAMKVFMHRHNDVWLSCAWENLWTTSMESMVRSPHIEYRHYAGECRRSIISTLHLNGIPLDRVIVHPICGNSHMPAIYAASDLGLFPNRCEGGTNLLMCEYMACGKPVIASDMTGQRDVIRQGNSIPLTEYSPLLIEENGVPLGVWFEPAVDEIIETLEFAYNNREELVPIGKAGAADMQRFTWQGAARQFNYLATNLALQDDWDERK